MVNDVDKIAGVILGDPLGIIIGLVIFTIFGAVVSYPLIVLLDERKNR